MEVKKDPFYLEDFKLFRTWLNFNLDGLTWQGRFRDEFERFWNNFFINGLSLSQVFERFKFAYFESKIGPLNSWFKWLAGRFVCYVFVFKDYNLFQISRETDIPIGEVANILRNFFIELHPLHDEKLNELFQVGNVASDNLFLDFKTLCKEIPISTPVKGSFQEEVMPSMEVTLYDEWLKFLDKMEKEFIHSEFNFKKIKSNASFKKQFKFLKEVVLLLLVGVLLVFLVLKGNEYYENYLVEKISVYEPQFKWLDKNLTFKPSTSEEQKDLEIDLNKIEEVDKFSNRVVNEDEERFETESETVLTSWDSLPKDFDIAEYERSDYEELTNRGYRDTRYGHTKVYRIMMKSDDTVLSKDEINKLMKVYKVSQVDNVKPGTFVPGGLYYNLYVPRVHIKEFLAQVITVNESIIYESRTRTRRNPPGKNKVFIWIKSI